MAERAEKLRVLVVEDEAVIAMLIEDMLMDLGHEVRAVASSMREALAQARDGSFDLALVDANLDGQLSYPVADILHGRGIPFIYATGYGGRGLDSRFAQAPILVKPFTCADLERVIARTFG